MYTHIEALGNEIAQMINEGKTQREIAAFFSSNRWEEVSPSIKYLAIYRHKDKYPVLVMCKFFGVSQVVIMILLRNVLIEISLKLLRKLSN